MAMEVDVLLGHKTGLYLDQRENRRLVRGLADGRRVLNLFAYTGGFSVAAAAGGARRVVSVDVGRPLAAAASRNFGLNALPESLHHFVVADAFAYLAEASERFDLIVIDPPSMAPSAAAVPGALRAYTRLNTLALGRAEPGALVLTCSCSSHVTQDHLLAVLRDAAAAARRTVRVVDVRGAGQDHPVVPGFPEGRYLHALLAHVT